MLILEIKNPGTVVYWEGVAYKASGTTIAEMQPEEITGLIVTLPGLNDYSKQPWTGKSNTNLAQSFVECIARNKKGLPFNGQSKIDDILNYANILGRNASKILFGDCSYRVVFYDNENKPVKNESKNGLFGILSDDFIKEIQKWSVSQTYSPQNPFADKALKEGIANAVAHAAYFENNGDLIIEVYPGKICISNLCLPDCGYFANRWFSRSHKTINGLLMEVLRLAGFVDELGRGKNLIFAESIIKGSQPPIVTIEKAGRYSRWRLYIYASTQNKIQQKLLRQIKGMYSDEQSALIAYALVLWRDKTVTDIRKYIDGESAPLFAKILQDANGPIFYWKQEDKIILRRWVKILIEEGKESKVFTLEEEDDLFKFAHEIQTEYHNGFVTTKQLRDLAHLGETASGKAMCSTLLKKWVTDGKIEKIKQGVYKLKSKIQPDIIDFTSLEELLKGTDKLYSNPKTPGSGNPGTAPNEFGGKAN